MTSTVVKNLLDALYPESNKGSCESKVLGKKFDGCLFEYAREVLPAVSCHGHAVSCYVLLGTSKTICMHHTRFFEETLTPNNSCTKHV